LYLIPKLFDNTHQEILVIEWIYFPTWCIWQLKSQ
jgi:hypothetical protein